MKFKLILFVILGLVLLSGCGGGSSSSSTSVKENATKNDAEPIELNTFDLENKVITLNNGVKMPVLGICILGIKSGISLPSNDAVAYKSPENALNEGKVRAVGLSNYYEPEDFDRLINATAHY